MIFRIIGMLRPSITDGMNTNVLTNIGVMMWGNSKPDCMKYNSPLPGIYGIQFCGDAGV